MDKNTAISRLRAKRRRAENVVRAVAKNDKGQVIGAMMGFYNDALPTSVRPCLTCDAMAQGWDEYGIEGSGPLWICNECGGIQEMHGLPNPDTLVEEGTPHG